MYITEHDCHTMNPETQHEHSMQKNYVKANVTFTILNRMFLLSVDSGEKLVAEVYELIILSRDIPLASHKFILLAFLVHFALQLFDINTK